MWFEFEVLWITFSSNDINISDFDNVCIDWIDEVYD